MRRQPPADSKCSNSRLDSLFDLFVSGETDLGQNLTIIGIADRSSFTGFRPAPGNQHCATYHIPILSQRRKEIKQRMESEDDRSGLTAAVITLCNRRAMGTRHSLIVSSAALHRAESLVTLRPYA